MSSIVIYESIMYLDAAKKKFVPLLKKLSSLIFNSDFFSSYSPECIDLGDKGCYVKVIQKEISGPTLEVLM